MKRYILQLAGVALFVALIVIGSPRPSYAQTSACFAGDLRTDILSTVRRTVALSGRRADSLRARTELPAVADTNSVTLVTGDSLCQAAVAAYRRELAAVSPGADTSAITEVVLVHVSPTRYVVFVGGRAGEFLEYHVFDDHFAYRATFVS